MKETDEDWIDVRLREMDTGRTWNATFLFPDAFAMGEDGQPLVHRSFKGTAVRIGDDGEAAIIFDRNQCRWAAAWTGAYLQHSDRRFGLLNTPAPAGPVQLTSSPGAGWSGPDQRWPEAPAATGPLPRDWLHFEGMHRHADRTLLQYRVGESAHVIETPWVEHLNGLQVFTRTLRIVGLKEPRSILLAGLDRRSIDSRSQEGQILVAGDGETATGVAVSSLGATGALRIDDQGRVLLDVPANEGPIYFKVLLARKPGLTLNKFSAAVDQALPIGSEEFTEWTAPGTPQWTERIVTTGSVSPSKDSLVIDSIGVPFDNPYKALMFLSGVDFLPQAPGPGDVFVSTVHGDVWRLRGVDADLEEVSWKRYATGLYQPLGLKVVNGDLFVLERGQLTRLHDLNADGEADFYEAFNGDWHVGGGEHSFDTCLETDPDGNFYFHSTGDPHVPTGGTLMQVSADGVSSNVFCTGFRHPIGLGVLPDGRIAGADQEGNWMPSTRIDIYRRGGFYGDMRCHHRTVAPETYDGPLCWLPRQLDGSAGGQIAVPPDHWGPLAGRMLHLSFGRCRMMLLMIQKIGDVEQAGAVDLGLQFDSGIQRGRFRPDDGHLYVVGMDGWQTAAIADGCLQRVRYTGLPWISPTDLTIEPDRIRLTFSQPLDREIAANPERYHIEQWNYHWSAEYGSARYSVASPGKQGQDEVSIAAVEVSDAGREIMLFVPNLQPVMQMQIDFRLVDAKGNPVDGVIYNTIHSTGR